MAVNIAYSGGKNYIGYHQLFSDRFHFTGQKNSRPLCCAGKQGLGGIVLFVDAFQIGWVIIFHAH